MKVEQAGQCLLTRTYRYVVSLWNVRMAAVKEVISGGAVVSPYAVE